MKILFFRGEIPQEVVPAWHDVMVVEVGTVVQTQAFGRGHNTGFPCPTFHKVQAGEKWSANIWAWNSKNQEIMDPDLDEL